MSKQNNQAADTHTHIHIHATAKRPRLKQQRSQKVGKKQTQNKEHTQCVVVVIRGATARTKTNVGRLRFQQLSVQKKKKKAVEL